MGMQIRKDIADEMFTGSHWIGDKGFAECPGKHLHTTPDTEMIIFIDGVPGLHCLHTGECRAIVEEYKRKFRRAVYLAERDAGEVEVSEDVLAASRERRDHLDGMQQVAEEKLRDLLAHPVAPNHWEHISPMKLDGPQKDDWRLALSMLPKDRTVWIGDKFDSGKQEHAACFKTVGEWLTAPDCPALFICPAYFKTGSYSRANQNVTGRAFVVLESDTLTKAEMGAVIKWYAERHPLLAIVDTGRRSLHAWFLPPADGDLSELKATFIGLKLDTSLLSASQPCRLPGIRRPETGKWQCFRYLDLSLAKRLLQEKGGCNE